MASKKIKSIKGRVMRLTRLDECGAPATSEECGVIVTEGFISVTLSNEIEAGEEYTQKNAWGDFCIAEKDGDRVKWANVAISMCEVDPEILDLVGGANPVVVGSDTIGATFGTEPNPNAFAIEVWTKKAGSEACGASGGNPEWGYFVVPYVRNGILDGDLTIENAPLTIGLKGEGIGASDTWGVGPHGDNPMKATTGFPAGDLYGIVVTDVQPPAVTDGCQPISGGTVPATGATAGAPGTWTPSGSVPSNDASDATADGIAATPNTAWTTGQWVQGATLGTAGEMHWDGSAWVTGKAP
jgi:hypothetical protein